MNKEKQQKQIRSMIDKGEITLFKEIFDYYDITPVINHLKTNHATLTGYITNAGLIRMNKIISIADYFDVDEKKMINIVYNQIVADRKNKKSRK
ncbi:MAG: hypothetical protein ACTHMC_18365 [Pseudobacter sp.]|uniref:hypothetical protein n=1 Tax=Pseudobacter sp. TaxID=2045420 RepID=UPI003F81953F